MRANRSTKHNGKQAEVLYRRAVAIVERELGLDNPALLQPLWWLAESDYRHKAYSKAEATFRRVRDIYEKAGDWGTQQPHAPRSGWHASLLSRAVMRRRRT
jgi:hypothetical protein